MKKSQGRKTMSKEICMWLLATSLLATVSLAEAQQRARVPRIGYLSARNDQNRDAFRQGLRELGYEEGKNIVVEPRWAEGKTEQLHDLVAELVRLKVDVIVTGVTLAAQAARKLTTTIPIVIVGTGDPVGTGLVASLARPGGNITGLSGLGPELSGKGWSCSKKHFLEFPAWASFGIRPILPTRSAGKKPKPQPDRRLSSFNPLK